MAIHNTAYDAANTAVRSFLTEIGKYYWGQTFNIGTGKGKQDWERIKDIVFKGECAYCGKKEALQADHLIMFNREQGGLHHPGNIVPACKSCNRRSQKNDKTYNTWEDHLSHVCETNGDEKSFLSRRKAIKKHVEEGDYRYPVLNDNEKKVLILIAENLYTRIKNEFEQAVNLFEQLDITFNVK